METVFDYLGAKPELLSCLLDVTRFLNLHSDRQKQILFDLLNISVTQGNLNQRFQDCIKAHPEVLKQFGCNEEDFSKLDGTTSNQPEGQGNGAPGAIKKARRNQG